MSDEELRKLAEQTVNENWHDFDMDDKPGSVCGLYMYPVCEHCGNEKGAGGVVELADFDSRELAIANLKEKCIKSEIERLRKLDSE